MPLLRKLTTADLFDSYEVKDHMRKKVKLKVWVIVFCCMASGAIHTDVVGQLTSQLEGFLWLTKDSLHC